MKFQNYLSIFIKIMIDAHSGQNKDILRGFTYIIMLRIYIIHTLSVRTRVWGFLVLKLYFNKLIIKWLHKFRRY